MLHLKMAPKGIGDSGFGNHHFYVQLVQVGGGYITNFEPRPCYNQVERILYISLLANNERPGPQWGT